MQHQTCTRCVMDTIVEEFDKILKLPRKTIYDNPNYSKNYYVSAIVKMLRLSRKNKWVTDNG